MWSPIKAVLTDVLRVTGVRRYNTRNIVKLQLTQTQAQYLLDILDIWNEGNRDTSEQMYGDDTIEDVDEFLAVHTGVRTQEKEATRIREMIHEQLRH